MLLKYLASSIGLIASAQAATRSYSTIQPALTDIELSAATATTNHITSDVKGGKLFDRFVVIWLENTDFDKAHDNDDMLDLLKEGILLTNNWALSHPSQENYLASISGDYFALDNDNFIRMPSNVSSIVDLLDTKGISWAEYQEHLPYTGYQGFQFKNQNTQANDYVRKHNPLIMMDSVVNDDSRLANIKNFTEFYTDLENETLPQWMFITPNMTNDGHDSTIAVAANWAKTFLTPLLNNTYFMENTLVLLTFDENETYSIPNKIWGLLLGGAIDDSLKGTEDDTFYDHYSEISTIEDNWSLPHLGRYDIDANVYKILADKSGWKNKVVDTSNLYNNQSKKGYFNDDTQLLPVPNCTAINQAGKGILPLVSQIWGDAWSSQIGASSSAAPSSSSLSSSSSSISSSTEASITSVSTTTPTSSSASKTSSSAAASSSVPPCEELGDDIAEFLQKVGQLFGNQWKQNLQNPLSIKDHSKIPVCEIEQDGKKLIQDILSYLEDLEKNFWKGIFHFDVNGTNVTNGSTSNGSSNGTSSTSASASSTANEAAANLGKTTGLLAGALLLLLQLI